MNEEFINNHLVCSITGELFKDPVLAEDGHTYERAAITEWIRRGGTSPFTRQRLDENNLRPNYGIKSLVDSFRRYRGTSWRASFVFEGSSAAANGVPRNVDTFTPTAPAMPPDRGRRHNSFTLKCGYCNKKRLCFTAVVGLIVIVAIILPIIFVLCNSSAETTCK